MCIEMMRLMEVVIYYGGEAKNASITLSGMGYPITDPRFVSNSGTLSFSIRSSFRIRLGSKYARVLMPFQWWLKGAPSGSTGNVLLLFCFVNFISPYSVHLFLSVSIFHRHTHISLSLPHLHTLSCLPH
jgi:hypothetical protein